MSESAATPSSEAPASGGASALGSWAESGSLSAPAVEAPAAPASAPGSTGAPAQPAASPVAGNDTAPPAPAPAQAEPSFELGGRTWKSKAEAEHWVKTTSGIGRAAQENRLAVIEARQRIAELERQLQEQRATPPPAQPNAAGGQAPPAGGTDPEKPLDDSQLAEVFGILTEKNGPVVAAQFLMQQMALRQEAAASSKLSALEQKINSLMEPLVQQHQQQAQAAQADQLISALSTYTTTGGRAAFPELQDRQAVAEIGQIWADLEGRPEDLLSIKGLIQAIALRRMAMAEQASTVSVAAGAAAPVTPPNPLTSAQASSAAAVASVSGDPPRTPPRPQTPQERVLADIRNAPAGNSPNKALPWAEQ